MRGLAPTDDGLSVLARASQKPVVNVAKRGGLGVAAVAHGLRRARRCYFACTVTGIAQV